MTDHVHDLRMIRDWTGGIVAKCDIKGCRKTLGIMEVNRRLNAAEQTMRIIESVNHFDANVARAIRDCYAKARGE